MTTTTGNPVTRPLAVIFSVNDGFIARAIEGLSEDDLWHRPSPDNNPMFWLLGHIVHTRGSVLRLLGDSFRTGWGDVFQRGSTVRKPSDYPSLDQIEIFRKETASRLASRLASVTDEQLAAEATYKLPGCSVLADQIGFLALHESYHVGQLAYIRKMLGRSGIVG